MTNTVDYSPFLGRPFLSTGLRGTILVAFALLLCLPSLVGVLPHNLNMMFLVAGVSLILTVIVFNAKSWIRRINGAEVRAALAAVIAQDDCLSLVANFQGEVCVANKFAQDRLHARPGSRLDHSLRSFLPVPASVLLRLQSQLEYQDRAEDEVTVRDGTIIVSAARLGADLVHWRFRTRTNDQWKAACFPVIRMRDCGTVLNLNSAAAGLLDASSLPVQTALPWGGGEGFVKTRERTLGVHAVPLDHGDTIREFLLLESNGVAPEQGFTSLADLPVPVMRLSLHGEILETNRLAVRLVGEHLPERTNIRDIMQSLGHPIDEWLERSREKDVVPRAEFLRLNRQDQEVFVQVTLSRYTQGAEDCLIAILNDATELKTMEAQFVQGQKMQAVGQLAGGVAHDFNNLLTAISGHCDLLLLRHDQNDPDYGDLVQINQNANRAAALVSQLLAFSRKQTLRPEVLDLRDTISGLIHLLNRLVGEKVRLTLSHDPVLKSVRADKRQLEQVLMNLVVNARDAMPEGGEIRIETEVLTLDKPLTRDRATVPTGEYVTVKVIDSGVGIPADKLQKVFEPFYTTKRTGEGTGLGLSTVYGIVKQTGGFIFVDSIKGRGTEFSIFLPVSTAVDLAEPAVEKKPEEPTVQQGEGVVLLVEDEAPVRAFATRALRLKGFTVLEAESAEEALRLLEDRDLNVDLFVTDVVMPGMDGPTWVRQAKETRPEVKVVFMSGYTEGAFGASGPEIPDAAFLPKPFSLNQLTEAVFQQLN